MGKVWTIARHEYVTNVRRTGFVLVTLLVPVVMALIIAVAAVFGGQAADFLTQQLRSEPEAVGVVDRSGHFTPLLPEYTDVYRLYADAEAGREALRAGEIELLMIITADYMATGKVEMVSPDGDLAAMMRSESRTARAFFIDHLLEGQADPALRDRLATPVDAVAVALDVTAEPAGPESGIARALGMVVPYLIAVLLIITLFTSSGYLLRSVANEKTSRVIEIILSSATPWELLTGKVLGLGALGLTQVVAWMGTGVLLSGGFATFLGVTDSLVSRGDMLALAMVYYLLGFLLYAVLMGGVGALGTTMEESQQLAGIFSLVAAVPLMAGGLIMQNPNMTVARVLSWFPLTSPTMMVLRLGLGSVPVVDVVGSLALLALTVPLALWAGAKLFRMGLLMYGKRPSLAEALRALRQS